VVFDAVTVTKAHTGFALHSKCCEANEIEDFSRIRLIQKIAWLAPVSDLTTKQQPTSLKKPHM